MSENIDESEYLCKLAVSQYTVATLFFYFDRCPYTRLEAMCVGVKNGHLITSASLEEIDQQQLVWGSEVNVYFTVRDDEITHCHFSTKLVRLYNAPANAMFLIFPLPKFIDHSQRRFSRRVMPEPEFLENVGVWHGEIQGGNSEDLPRLRWINLRNEKGIIGEISANGLRLDLPAKSASANRIMINDRILLRGDFGTRGKPAPIFIIAMVVRKMIDPENEDICGLGCHFLSWRKVDDPKNTSWLKADSQEGIGLVAQWVSRNFHNLGI